MDDPHIVNITERTDVFEDIWISGLFAPIVVLYVFALVWVSNLLKLAEALPMFKDINEILGYGIGTILLLAVQFASLKSKNDFIAGPIEQLNLYTFFFLGMVTGGFGRALLFTILYEVLETYGLPAIVKSISANERVKATSLGIQPRKFVLYQYIFAPFATVLSMVLAYILFVILFPSAMMTSRLDFASQIGNLTLFIALWTFFQDILNELYYRSIPQAGCASFLFSFSLLVLSYHLNRNNWIYWGLYGLLILFGWVMTYQFIIRSIKNARPLPGSENVKYITWK